MYFAATFVATLIVSASALATPHVHGMPRRHQHAALAKARAVAPEPVAEPVIASAAIHKRQLKKRCKPRKPSSKLSPTSTVTHSSATHSSAASSHPTAPANVAPVPLPPLPISIGTTSSDDPAPSPSSTPSPSSSKSKPSPTSSQDPSPSQGGDGGGSSPFSGSHQGEGTFYGTGLGACGITNKDSDPIVAISKGLFDSYPGYNGVNPNTNPVCGKKIKATYQGKQVEVEVTDRCVGCAEYDLDFSPNAFDQIADPAIGRLQGVDWVWV